MNQLKGLQDKLYKQKKKIEIGIDRMENKKGDRDLKRKELLLHEVQQILSSLWETAKKQVKDIKSEIFDQLGAMVKIQRETEELLKCVSASNPQGPNTMEWAFFR